MMKQQTSSNRKTYACWGFLLGLGAPLGWLAYRFFGTQRALLLSWLAQELSQSGLIYAYMTVGTVTVFMLFGYVLGRNSDTLMGQSLKIKDSMDKVHTMAITDALTGIYNARYLHDHLSLELDSAKRYGTPLTCLMLDIDDFKKINDTYGHPPGDEVLVTLAKTILSCIRRVDSLSRLGGEEFLVMMPHTGAETAFPIAERIRQAVEHTTFIVQGKRIPLTVSIGVASYPLLPITDKRNFLKTIDEALYQAKRAGKNRTIVAKEPIRDPASSPPPEIAS